MRTKQPLRLTLVTTACLLLASCASQPREPAIEPSGPGAQSQPAELQAPQSQSTEIGSSDNLEDSSGGETTGSSPVVALGSGNFVQRAATRDGDLYATEDDGVTLNFEQADLKEFLRVVFDSILGENYLIDPLVRGTVTLHTTRPVTRDAVVPIVESVLQGNGAALVWDDGMFRIVPIAEAETITGAPAVGRFSSGRATGFGTQVVPLQHVSAGEMQKILQPFVPEGATLRVDTARNVMILTGPRYRIDELLATIRTFDVDWLAGMSFAMFELQYADAVTLVEELEVIIGQESTSPLRGIVKLVPIERLNSVLVITHMPAHVGEVQRLLEQLDQGVEGSAGRRLFVYELENGKAENIAESLRVIFVTGGSGRGGTQTADLQGRNPFHSADDLTSLPPDPQTRGRAEAAPQTTGLSADGSGNVKIISDPDNNAILVLASQEDYRTIEAAIRRLDVAPRQVLIEATIAEVTLSNSLDYGVRWFLEKSDYELGFNAPVPGSATGSGLAFAFFDADSDLSAFFDVLANESGVRFLSTPQVMVLDNQTANIRVGDQIPVTTRSSQSTTNPDAPIVTEVQFRDTGTLLSVTPRINAGGQVTLEISQEVSLPGTEPAVGGGGNVSIAQRTINSSVIVQSGQTVVLGGLILETKNEGKSGIPVLMNIPLVGTLFSSNSEDVFRTELIVTVKPRVIENPRAMQRVTQELRDRMSEATRYEQSVN
jgi:general secretion pathway protein D